MEDQVKVTEDWPQEPEAGMREKFEEKQAKAEKKINPLQLENAKRKAKQFVLTQYPHFKKLEEFLNTVPVIQAKMAANKLGSNKMNKETGNREVWLNSSKILDDKRGYGFYSRASAHLMAPNGGLKGISMFERLVMILVHEYTHSVQFYEGTQPNEVDTTRNEIEYMRLNLQTDYLLLVPSQHKPPYIRGQRVILEGDQTLWRIDRVIWFPTQRSWKYYLVNEKDKGHKSQLWDNEMIKQVTKWFKPKPKKSKK